MCCITISATITETGEPIELFRVVVGNVFRCTGSRLKSSTELITALCLLSVGAVL